MTTLYLSVYEPDHRAHGGRGRISGLGADATRARTYPYLVCSWNPTGDFAQATQGLEHGDAFLVAPITAVEPAPESPARYILRFTEFARVRGPTFGAANEIRSTTPRLATSESIEIFFVFEKAEKRATAELPVVGSSPSSDLGPLPISAAKPRLAAYYDSGDGGRDQIRGLRRCARSRPHDSRVFGSNRYR